MQMSKFLNVMSYGMFSYNMVSMKYKLYSLTQ